MYINKLDQICHKILANLLLAVYVVQVHNKTLDYELKISIMYRNREQIIELF